MGITTKIVKTVTCDRCGNECEEGENFINYRFTNAAGEVVATGQSGAWSWVREMESRNEECS